MAMLPDRPPGRRTGPEVTTPQARPNVENPVTDTDSLTPGGDEIAELAEQLKRRREASWRLPPLECGHRDPLDCRRAS